MAINPHVARLFDYVTAGKAAQPETLHFPLQVGSAKFGVTYVQILNNKHRPGAVVVPGTKVRMPVFACLDIPPEGFRPDEAKALAEMPKELETKLKEANVFCFYDRKKLTFKEAPEMQDDLNDAQLADNDVQNGIWYSKEGLGFKVGNEPGAPAMYLSRYARKLLPFYPDVVQWVTENPPPKSSIEPIMNWYRKLGAKFVEEGWHLLWRGVLYTGHGSRTAARDYMDLSDELKSEVSQWPDNTKIEVFTIWSSKVHETLGWGAFKGMEDKKPKGLQALFHANLDEVYKTYRVAVDTVVQSNNAVPT